LQKLEYVVQGYLIFNTEKCCLLAEQVTLRSCVTDYFH